MGEQTFFEIKFHEDSIKKVRIKKNTKTETHIIITDDLIIFRPWDIKIYGNILVQKAKKKIVSYSGS